MLMTAERLSYDLDAEDLAIVLWDQDSHPLLPSNVPRLDM